MTRLLTKLRALILPSAETREMDEELRYHLDQQIAQHVARGMSPEAARTEALRSMGGLERRKDEMRDARGVSTFEHLGRDLRHAWRSLARMPLTALVIVLSLAIGIGANATIFSWIQLVILNPMPGVKDAGKFHHIEVVSATGGYPGSSWLEWRDLRERTTSFENLLGFSMAPMNVGEAPRTERAFGVMVSPNYFAALGLAPALGRLIQPTDAEQPGSNAVVVVSHGFWTNRLGRDSSAVGRTIIVNGSELTVVGVTPEGFQGTVLGLDFALWVPATMAPVLFPGSRSLDDRGQRGYHLMSLLKDGVTQAQAEQDLNAVLAELAALYPQSNANFTGEVPPFWKAPMGPQRMLARGLLSLQGILLLLLLAVCGNTVNLMLARASTRQKEMGARLALGAGRGRIMSLVLTENMLMAVAAGAIGALLAMWGTNALRAIPFIGTFPIRFQTQVDGVTLAFCVGLGVFCGLVFGLAPALNLSRTDPQVALRAGFGPLARGRMRGVLMGAEVALALVVLVAGAILFRSFREARSDSGFRQSGILLVGYDLSARNPTDSATLAFTDRLLTSLRSLPGVTEAAISSSVPLDIHGLSSWTFRLEGRAREDANPDRALANVVTPGYFAVMDIPFVAGSDFAPLSDRDAPPQAIVNEEFVRLFMDGREPLGRRIIPRQKEYVIVGVVKNSLYNAFGEPPRPIVYYSYREISFSNGQIHLRTRDDAEHALAPAVERAVRTLDPTLPVYDVRTMGEHVDKNLFLRKIPARLFAVLGPLLLILAAIGIYAVVDYAVTRRTHEIGLRLALGASRQRVMRQFMRETLRVVAFGTIAGLFLALAIAMHVAQGVISLPIFIGVPALLLAVAALACWLPARKAAGVDPMVALRRE